MCVTVTNTYTKIFVCTLKYICVCVCVGVVAPKCLLFAFKKNSQTAVAVISKPISNTVYQFLVSLSWTERSAMSTVSQQTRGEGRLQVQFGSMMSGL